MGVSGAAYQWGLSAIWLFPSCLGGFLINWVVLAGPLRKLSYKTGALTVTEILAGPVDQAYHKLITRIASIILLISMERGKPSRKRLGSRPLTASFWEAVW